MNTVYHNSRKISDAPAFFLSRARSSTITRGSRASTLNANQLAFIPETAEEDGSAREAVFDVIGNPMLSDSGRSGDGNGNGDDEMPGAARRSITA